LYNRLPATDYRRPTFGFVLPQPFGGPIHHNSFSPRHLHFLTLSGNWLCLVRLIPRQLRRWRCRPAPISVRAREIGFVWRNRPQRQAHPRPCRGVWPCAHVGKLASFGRNAWAVQVVMTVSFFFVSWCRCANTCPGRAGERDAAEVENNDTGLLTAKPPLLIPILIYRLLCCYAITIHAHKFLVKHNSS
jgi:hypothetical protein